MAMQNGLRIGIGVGVTDALPRDGKETLLSPDQVTSATKGVWWDPTDDTYVTLASGDTVFSVVLNKFLLGSNDGSALGARTGNSLFGVTSINGARAMQAGATDQAMHSTGQSNTSMDVGSGSFHIMIAATADFVTSATAGLVWTLANHGSTDRWRMGVNTNVAANTSRWGLHMDDGPTLVQAFASSDGSWNDDGGNPHLFEVVRHNTDGMFYAYVDGALMASASIPGGFGDMDDATQNLLLGATPGAGTSTGQWWDGKIGDFTLFQGELDSDELTQLRAWFYDRWGIA